MLMIAVQFLALVVFGALLAESAGYVWHRWACHVGVFRKVFNDFFRRRHFDHHMLKYGVKRLHSHIYEQSCEVAFHPMGVGIILVLACLAFSGLITWLVFVAILGGALVYAVYGLGGMHTLYHLDDEVVRRMWLFRKQPIWRMYVWLRDYHLVHHYVKKNFAILLPIFDILGRSYMSPSELPVLKLEKGRRENLFPGFDAKLSSSCGLALF